MPFFIFLILFVIMVVIVKNLNRWGENNSAPELTVAAVVDSKGDDTPAEQSNDPEIPGLPLLPHRRCAVTFQTETGESLSFSVSESEYRSLQPGERGQLTFQGTRYLGFVRLYEESRSDGNGEESV